MLRRCANQHLSTSACCYRLPARNVNFTTSIITNGSDLLQRNGGPLFQNPASPKQSPIGTKPSLSHRPIDPKYTHIAGDRLVTFWQRESIDGHQGKKKKACIFFLTESLTFPLVFFWGLGFGKPNECSMLSEQSRRANVSSDYHNIIWVEKTTLQIQGGIQHDFRRSHALTCTSVQRCKQDKRTEGLKIKRYKGCIVKGN